MQITSPDPILGTYIAHNPWLWLAWHIFLLRECAVLSFYAWVLNNHPSSGMNVELYNFTYLTFFPKYLCHLLMQVSLLLAFPIKLFYQIDSNHSLSPFTKFSQFKLDQGDVTSEIPLFVEKGCLFRGASGGWDRSQMSVALPKISQNSNDKEV